MSSFLRPFRQSSWSFLIASLRCPRWADSKTGRTVWDRFPYQQNRFVCILRRMVVRMKDIAKDVGVSVVTISKVLRNHPDIADETRERVLRRVKELDYQPNAVAQSLVTGRSYLIGLVVPSLLHSFF